jgi:CheY-like chemotaxis protein
MQKYPKENKLRIIAMTACASADDKGMCIQASIDDYISKPFKKEELMLVLERSINFVAQ